jgi:hypothetical protein
MGPKFDLLEANYFKLLEMYFFYPSHAFWGVKKIYVFRRKK